MLKEHKKYIKLNGKSYKVVSTSKVTLNHILIFFGYKLNLIAVEYNDKILLPINWKKIYIQNNIKIEVVTIVGGG
jgi:thiamine biosynthesis protein ThiS